MFLWKILPFTRRVAFVYVFVISLLFLVHFKVVDDFTYKHIKNYSKKRCEFGCFRDMEFYKLFSVNTHPAFYSRLNSTNQSGPRLHSDINDGNRILFQRQFGFARVLNNTGEKDFLYQPPPGESPSRRFPQSVIIGFTKCGTRALIEFLSLHPYLRVARNEVHFYERDENFSLGYEWYREQMPLTYSNQITMEKTPAYVLSQRARDEMHRITPNVRLILLVRDPVVRLVSQYILRFRLHNTDEGNIKPVSAIFTNFSTGKFDPNLRPVDIGNYHKHIAVWLEKFSLQQMLIVNSEDLTRHPLDVLKRVERFLDIPSLFSEFNVYYNETSGFYCPKGFGNVSTPHCLGRTKGLPHPKLSTAESAMLYEYYKPYNEKLFKLLGYRLNWTEKQWGKEE